MAITVTQRYQARPTAQTATTAFSPTSTIQAGTVALLVGVGGVSKVISSVSDSASNTWVVDATNATGAQGKSFASCQVATQITTGGTITITWSVATSSAIAVWVQELGGMVASSVFDKTSTNSGSGTAVTSGSTGTLSQAVEVAFAVFRTSVSTTWAKGASWTDPTSPFDGVNCSLEYQIVAATTALNADGTFGATGSWSALTATYKGSTAVAASLPIPSRAYQQHLIGR